jgi:hypothetical protein
MKLVIMQFLQLPTTCSVLFSDTLLSSLFSNNHSLHSFLNVRDKVSHPYKTIDKFKFLCILIFMFLLDRKAKGFELNGDKHCTHSICIQLPSESNFGLLMLFPKLLNFATFLKDVLAIFVL